MLQLGDEVTLYSVLFLVVLLGTRSAAWTTVLTMSVYIFVAVFRFPQVPTSRAKQVLHPDRGVYGTGKVSAIAHRGGGHDAPENTLAAIREASKNGATGVELDLEFSADGVPVLMHDETVDRTTNGSGPLTQIKYSELTKLDAAAKHRLSSSPGLYSNIKSDFAWATSPLKNSATIGQSDPQTLLILPWRPGEGLKDKFSVEKIPTLEEAVEECIRLQLTIYFDVKGHPDEAAAALKVLYKKYPVLYNSSIVCSFEPKVIYRMRQSDPGVVTALTHRPWSLSHFGDGVPRFMSLWKHYWMTLMDVVLDWAHHHVLWRFCGVSAFLIQKNFVSPDYVQYWAQRGVEVVAWTINTKVEKEYYQEFLQVNYITDSLVEDCEPHY